MRSTHDIRVGGFEGSQSQPTDFTGIGRQMAHLAETGYGQGLSAVLVLKKYRQTFMFVPGTNILDQFCLCV